MGIYMKGDFVLPPVVCVAPWTSPTCLLSYSKSTIVAGLVFARDVEESPAAIGRLEEDSAQCPAPERTGTVRAAYLARCTGIRDQGNKPRQPG